MSYAPTIIALNLTSPDPIFTRMASIGGQGNAFIVLREKTDRGDIDRDWQQIVSLVDKDRDKGSNKETDKR